jgi:hypothetical protein
MSIPIRLPTNCEIIYRDQPDNLVIVNIPHTKYSLACEQLEKNNWTMHMVNLDSPEKELINENLTTNQVGRIVNTILRKKEASAKNSSLSKEAIKAHLLVIITKIVN